ncbi:RIP metalloprotease RseP [Clostridium sp.]|uniref:RIP metalloprotease RseP n=1 Tax=Clostridium sp. TaxID=1506 RepID=UPI003D6C796B
MSSFIGKIPYFIMAILAFSLLIIIHELGHFMLAKLNGVKVHEFSLGMGPKIFGIKGKETEYLIKAFPIGGYVKMEGENEESDDPRSLANKTPWQKLSIVSAGAIMNIILAFVLFSIIGASIGGDTMPTVGDLVPNSPALHAGIKVGDKITKVNKVNIEKWDQFVNEISTSKGKSTTIEIVRNSKLEKFTLTPIMNEKENKFMIGIAGLQKKLNFGEAVGYGFNQTINTSKMIFGIFGSIFKGKVSINDVGGPISIIRISTMFAQAGIINLMLLTAMLSVQLGILNIIPFPALDGGWIFILLFEIISGKKLDDKKVAAVNYVGFMILMAFMVFIVIKDIVNPMKF